MLSREQKVGKDEKKEPLEDGDSKNRTSGGQRRKPLNENRHRREHVESRREITAMKVMGKYCKGTARVRAEEKRDCRTGALNNQVNEW